MASTNIPSRGTHTMKTTLHFVKDRETKGTVVFRETDDKRTVIENNRDAVIGSIYIQKTYLKGTAPESITVTLEHP